MDNATIDGVTYNVELSKNLLKQFNEMNRNNAAAGTGMHQSGTSSPVPIQTGMSLNPNAAVFGQSPHSQSPHGGPAPWPTNGNAYGQNKFSPSNSRGGGGGYGGASPGYPMPMPPQMGQQAQMQQRYSPQAYSPPPGQIMGMPGMGGHAQPALGTYHKRTNSQPISSLLADANLQSMYRPDPYANAYGSNEPHMGAYGRYGGESQQSAHGQYDLNQTQGQGFQQQQQQQQAGHFDPFQDADQFYEQDCERSHVSHASGGAHSSITSRSPHSISPLPGHSRRESEDFTQPAHPTHAHHVRQGSNGSHNSALYGQQSYGHGALDGGVLHNADQFAHSAAYSPMSNGAISPMYDSDRDYGRYGANKPAPLNLNGLSTPNHISQGQGLVHGGSSVSSANSVRSLPSVPSGSTSPLPTGRAGANNTGNAKPSGASYWENDAAGVIRADKPPTPAGNRAVGAPTRHGGLPMGPAPLILTSNSCSSGSTSQESTPTHAYAKVNGSTGVPAAVSPTSAGVAAAQYGQLSAGLAMGITPSLPPSGPLGRSGLQSRSSSTSSATASTVGVFSGTVSPMPGQYGTSSGSSSARKPAGLTELDMHGINRSMSNGSDRNPALSTLCTTDSEGGFFNSNNSSFRLEHTSTSASSEVSHREQQAVLASHIMLGGISLPSMLTDDRMELHKQAYEAAAHGGRETFHNEYFAELKHNAPIEPPVVASRPQRLNMAMKQLSLQSVSTIGEDGAEDYLEDEFNYSSASSLSPMHSSSSLNLGLSASNSQSFRIDTSFMLSPQSSTQSLETSPFAQYANESFRGRPPSGSAPMPSAQTSIYPPNATAPALLRRTFQLDGVTSHVDDEGEPEGINALAMSKDSRPVSLNSMTSNDSSQLAGIAIGSSSGEWEGRTDQGSHSPKEEQRRGARPEGIRLSRGKSSLSTTSIAIAEVPLTTPVESKVEAKPEGGKRQLSLTQFFKPMARAASAGEN